MRRGPGPEQDTLEQVSGTTLEHPALQAWCDLQRGRIEAPRITTVKERAKSAIYRLEGLGPEGSAVIAKRCQELTATIERTIYEEILPHLPAPTLRYYGCVAKKENDSYWLFLEDAGGEKYSSTTTEHRLVAARWLGLMHLTAASVAAHSGLPERGPAYYRAELRTTRRAILQSLGNPVLEVGDVVLLKSIVSQFDVVESHWRLVEALCSRMPPTLVHGDFTGKNVRIQKTERGLVLLPFDWELAGWGPPAVDLSQLIRIRKVGETSVVPGADSHHSPDGRTRSADRPRQAADSVSQQCTTYLSIVRPRWPFLEVQDVMQLANIGAIFRLIQSIGWEHLNIADDRAHGCEYVESVRWAMGVLRGFWSRMNDALQAVEWEVEGR